MSSSPSTTKADHGSVRSRYIAAPKPLSSQRSTAAGPSSKDEKSRRSITKANPSPRTDEVPTPASPQDNSPTAPPPPAGDPPPLPEPAIPPAEPLEAPEAPEAYEADDTPPPPSFTLSRYAYSITEGNPSFQFLQTSITGEAALVEQSEARMRIFCDALQRQIEPHPRPSRLRRHRREGRQ